MKNSLIKILIIIFLLLVFKLPITNTTYVNYSILQTNLVSAGCWVAPSIPELVYPLNNTYAGAGSDWDLNPYMDWNDSTSICPLPTTITYQYESYRDQELSQLIYRSDWLNSSQIFVHGMPEGTYYWQVHAKDNQGNISAWSEVWKLTIDRTPPTASLSVSGSDFKETTESVVNGSFETGDFTGWEVVGNTQVKITDFFNNPNTIVTPLPDETNMARISRRTPYQYVWENRIMQSFESGAKTLALYYDFFSRDIAPYDDPGFLIRINGQEVFRLSSEDVNPLDLVDNQARGTGWQKFYYDLSDITDSQINLAIYAGNTEDTNSQSFVYLDKITTNLASVGGNTQYKITGFDNEAIDTCYYKLDDGSYTDVVNDSSFMISALDGDHTISFYCQDKAHNLSATYVLDLIIDSVLPQAITDLRIEEGDITNNSALLTWTAPGNNNTDGKASKYDIRYQENCSDTSLFDFDTAIKIDKVPAPKIARKEETLEILGLNPDTDYCFGIKSADEAPNWSYLSNIITARTDLGETDNFGDVVINEIMWMGSSIHKHDEWIELKNMTNRTIDLSDWTLETESGLIYTFPSDSALNASEYLVVSEFNAANSALKNEPDYLVGVGDTDDSLFKLNGTALKLYLYSAGSDLIDEVGDEESAFAGLKDTVTNKYYSMERTEVPGDGTDALNWYTCIDFASILEFFDSGNDERGTPGAKNRSENEPVNIQTVTPVIALFLSEDNKTLTIQINNIKDFKKLKYILTYESNGIQEAVLGETEIKAQDSYIKKIVVGTCSTEGTCVYHLKLEKIKVEVELINETNQVTKLSRSLE